MKLSIIIPIYNVKTTLQRCLDSIILQDLCDYEMILVDDGSTDDSSSIAQNYANQYTYIMYYRKNNGGLSDARNFGLSHAKGEYITFVDSDDCIMPNTYKPLLDILYHHPEYDILEYAMLQNPGCNNEFLFSPGNHVFKNAMDWLSYKGYEHSWVCNKIYKRIMFQDTHFTLKRKYEDILLLPVLLTKHPVIATTSKGTYVYYYNNMGIAAKDHNNGLTELLEAQMEVTKVLNINTRDKKFQRLYLNMFTAQLYSYCKTGKIELWPQRIAIRQYGSKSNLIKSILLYIFGLKISCLLFKYLINKKC